MGFHSSRNQGGGEGERQPQEASRRKGTGHRHAQGGESGKLLSPARRRRAVKHLQQKFRVSERRACRVVGQPRSSQRHVSEKVRSEEHTSELQSRQYLVCRLLLEKKK